MQPSTFKNSPGGRRQRNDDRWHSFSPHVLAVRGLLLVDDIIYTRVQKAADWTIVRASKVTKGRLQLTKRRLIIPTLALGTVASTAAVGLFEGQGVVGALKWLAICGTIKLAALGFSFMSLHDTINEDHGDVKTLMQRHAEIFLLAFRMFGLAAAGTLVATANYSKPYDIYISLTASAEFLSLSLAAYIASASNGMLGRAKDWVKGVWQLIREKTRVRVPVPVPADNRNEPFEASA